LFRVAFVLTWISLNLYFQCMSIFSTTAYKQCVFVFFISISTLRGAQAAHFVTPQELAETAAQKVHLGAKVRSCEQIIADLEIGGRNIGTAAAMAKTLYGEGTKVFHAHSIGSTFVQLELNPHRPDFLRHGMFSDGMPQTSYGFANFSTGRSTPAPPHLKPDVTGLTVVLDMNGLPVVLTTTAAQGAFADTAVEFSELAWFPHSHDGFSRGLEQS
jgi:hypothetical protein